MSQQEIAKKFPQDGELVAMWVVFLQGNHLAAKDPMDVGYKWTITEKGKEWISRYNFE